MLSLIEDRAAGCNQTQPWPNCPKITITLLLSLFKYTHTHAEVCVGIYKYIYSNKYQHMLVLSYVSNQDILVAISADIHISLHHSPCGQSNERSRVSGHRCHAELRGAVRRRLAAWAIQAGQTSGRLAVHPARAGDWSRISQREKHVYYSSN